MVVVVANYWSLTMAQDVTHSNWVDESRLVVLARELALDIAPLETILKNTGTTPEQLEAILKLPRFQQLLLDATQQWGSALNTAERIKVKALAQLEDWLPELHERLHDPKETLAAKIEGGKLLRSLAGIAERGAGTGEAMGERFQLTINIGESSKQLEVTHKVIEGEVAS
jgi:DNA-binding transcriptional MerR regulator